MNERHDALLAEVLTRYDASPSPRLAEVTRAAIRHLHAFVAEVGLQHDEWMAGIQFLTATGKICDDVRQEFILLSDTLGVSTLVEAITHLGAHGTTENTVLGPFYVPGSPERAFGASMLVDPDDGDRVVIRGQVTNIAGEPLAGVSIDAWQCASTGFYACQQPGIQHSENLRGVYRTDDDGRFEIRSVRPAPYPIPDDGPAGQLLKDNGRNWWRPGHTHLWFTLPGYKQLITHVFDTESPYLDDDAVFGTLDSLVCTFEADATGELATSFDVVLDDA
jgi:catechol 1,2-dioxygenase